MASHGILSQLNLWKTVFFDKRTPFAAKALLVLGAVYGISPLDFIPDFIPVLGQLDDIGVIVVVITAFIRMSRFVADELRKGSAIDATARERK